MVCKYGDPNRTVVHVYSLRTNSWKLVVSETTPTSESIRNPVLVQNHLLVMIFEDGYYRLTRIGCFDIKAERWSNDVLLSDIVLDDIGSNLQTRVGDGHYQLGVLDGRLLFSCYDKNKSTYNVWVTKDCGVKESWVKLMSLPGEGSEGVYQPIAYRKGSSHELLCIPTYRGKYFWYNLIDKQVTKTGLDGDAGLIIHPNFSSFAYICKRSLLNFPGGESICLSSKEQEEEEEEEEEEEDYDDVN
ncbi:F-box protein At4g22390-like [Silene latifolia]|uniref:F-box protein At4g22390-like n=1 Tax=Silene latifolia TaxID=37657 RepID=UPI003D784499